MISDYDTAELVALGRASITLRREFADEYELDYEDRDEDLTDLGVDLLLALRDQGFEVQRIESR